YEELGQRELKGVGQHRLYKVHARRPRQAILRGSYSVLSPFIGRAEQLAQALEQISSWAGSATADAGGSSAAGHRSRSTLMVITGEQAIGKSRFALELVRRLPGVLPSSVPLVHATAHCSEYATPQTFTAEVAQIAGLSAANLEQRWAELCGLAGRSKGAEYAERQRRHLPLLAYVLNAPGIDTSGIRQSSPQAFETGCRLALRACCDLAALEGGQLVLVIEDLQWLGGLRPLLAELLQQPEIERPLIVVATARPEFDSSAEALHRLLGRAEGDAFEARNDGNGAARADHNLRQTHRVIDLPLLSAGQGEQLIQQLLPGVKLPAELTAELHEKACGLPYYYEEFARMLADSGMVREVVPAGAAVPPGAEIVAATVPGRYRLDQQSAELAMPDDIRMLLLGRLDMLSPDCKELALRASVLGRSFSLELMARIDEQLELETGEWLPRGLAELEQAGILVSGGAGQFMFEHVLTREAAYDSLLKSNRRLVHGAAADALAADLTPGSPAEVALLPQLVDHLERAGRQAEAHDRC
ncbi:MAG TPA: hypothetical protein ENO21_02900, partial [Firmicutes bacterium]|nr:hypothetical protein [Bacillota bacterium]